MALDSDQKDRPAGGQADKGARQGEERVRQIREGISWIGVNMVHFCESVFLMGCTREKSLALFGKNHLSSVAAI